MLVLSLVHVEPPTDDLQRLRRRREYLDFKLDGESEAFENFRSATIDQATLSEKYVKSPGLDPMAPEQLPAGQHRIDKIRRGIERINRQLQGSTDEEQYRLIEQTRIEQQTEASKVAAEVREIQI